MKTQHDNAQSTITKAPPGQRLSHAVALTVLFTLVFGMLAGAQGLRPELMYFRFDQTGQSTLPNLAAPATRVTTTANVLGNMSQGSTGQFGSALVGTGGSPSNDIVQTGWTPNLGNNSWTISFWLNNVPSSSTLNYVMGDDNAGSWRVFSGGVAGNGNLRMRGPVKDITISNVAPGPTVVHFVYDNVAGELRGYRNGVLVTTVSQSAINIQGSGGTFNIGGHDGGGGSGALAAGELMDEFRLYNRALTSQEISDSWDIPVIGTAAENDAGVASIDSPFNFCAGTNQVDVTLTNYGANQITSATIQWTVNGAPQTPIQWTGLLDTISAVTRSTSVTLGNYDFQSGMSYTIAAWSELPNGVQDTVNSNDMSTAITEPAISGTMTIGGTAPNFNSFSDAISAMESIGLCGPIVFKVRAGTYNEQVSIGNIPGSSAANTITFESESGNRNDVHLEYSATSSSSNWVLLIDGSKYVTFQDMTISATGTSYTRVIEVENGALYTTLDNLVLNGRNVSSTSSNYAIIYSTTDLDDNTTIQNCEFNNGSNAMYWEGISTSSLESGTVIRNNTFKGYYDEGLYISYQNDMIVDGNTFISTSTYSGQEQMYLRYCDNQLRVINNTVNVNSSSGTKTGIYLYYCDATPGNPGLIANNFITIRNGSSTAYGLYPDQADYHRLFHNSVWINTSSTNGRALYSEDGIDLQYMNNLFINEGNGYAVYTDNTSSITLSDYNVFHTNGTRIGYWGGTRNTLADWQAASGEDANTIDKLPEFSSTISGDLHLTGVSENDPDMIGVLVPEVTTDIDGDTRVLPYRGADEACFIIAGSHEWDIVDASGAPARYANIPGQIGINYQVTYPDDEADINVTVRFFSVPNNTLQHTETFTVHKMAGVPLNGFDLISLNALPAGTYRVEVMFNAKNSCGTYKTYSVEPPRPFIALPPGQQPCIVWPGDANNDGLVNYGDRKSLTTYIHDANLNPLWLNGPARYRPNTGNPVDPLAWEPQPAMPWDTPDGCFMDTDGNGTINSFDFVAIKLNWMRDHGIVSPKDGDQFSAATFDMSQNYPNPFNPTTQIQFSAPERSSVQIVVLDMLGRSIATLASGVYEAGVYTSTFDASGYSSGTYTAIATMTGENSGLSFSKTIRMNLTK